MKPLRIEANSTGFLVRNLTENEVLVDWDKVAAGRKFEVVVSCPACSRKIKMRSGLHGTVPLDPCNLVCCLFPIDCN